MSYAITPAEEEKLSREFMKMIDRRVTLIKDPMIQGYVEKVGRRIVKVLPPQPFKYHFYVVREPVYNAFAGPAGHVFINSGLFADMGSYEEMAGILGHEISHVACRHISDKIEKMKKVGVASIAGLVAAIGLSVVGAGALANAAMVGTLAAGQELMSAYSREDEMQADQLGLVYLTEAGYGADGLMDSLKRIRSRQWFGKDIVPTYMMTHPALEDRLAYVGGWVESHPEFNIKEVPAEQSEFLMVRNRLIALYLEPETALKRLKDQVDQHPEDFPALYGLGLVMMRTGDLQNAESYLKKALDKRPLNPPLLSDLGQIYFQQGRYEDAGKILSGALAMSPDLPDALFYTGRVRIATSDFKGALESLETLADKRPDYPEIQYYLANAQEGAGRADLSHYHLALNYKEKGDWENSILQLKRAIAITQDPVERDKMNERLKEFEKERKKDRDEEQSSSKDFTQQPASDPLSSILKKSGDKGRPGVFSPVKPDRTWRTAW